MFLTKRKNNGNLKNDNIWKINLINYNIFWIREFLQNDYERRFNVPIEIVLNALVGEKNLIQENEKQKNYKQEFIKNIKNCNFYRIFEKNNNIKNNF